jgi:hypothetical protein
VGQQDLSVRSHDGGSSLFGIGSVSEISFPLDMRDPRFDTKARARGIDPARCAVTWAGRDAIVQRHEISEFGGTR